MESSSDLPLPALIAALKWQALLGVDEALGVEAVTLGAAVVPFAQAPAPSPAPAAQASTTHIYSEAPSPAPVRRPVVTAAPVAAAPVVLKPRSDLATITDLETLKAEMQKIEGLSLKDTAMSFVFGEGALNPPVMLIGEAPGEEEDRTGRPFVGRAGLLLEKMLASIGLERSQVYITNTLPWRPPGNRTPKTEEIAACLPFLLRHIELVKPKTLLLMGGPAAKSLLGRDESVTRLRGKWWDYKSEGLEANLPALVTYHPAYLLRTPSQKRESWADLRRLKSKFDEL